jgi:hypothetical protein
LSHKDSRTKEVVQAVDKIVVNNNIKLERRAILAMLRLIHAYEKKDDYDTLMMINPASREELQ